MNLKQKLIYMALGGTFTLLGYTLANLGNDVTAQSEPTIVDQIVCRQLRIVDAQDRTVAILGDYLNDILSVYNTEGHQVVGIGRDKNGGSVIVNHNSGERAVSIGIGIRYKEGLIYVKDKNGESSIELGMDKYGAGMAIFNRGKKNVLQASVSDRGYGIIRTRDKNGYKTGQLP